jgi:hypothetical protein
VSTVAYVDEEALLYLAIPALITGAVPGVGTSTPADPTNTYAWASTGFVKVQRIGGGGRYGLDSPRVFVECFAPDYGTAKALAARVRTVFEVALPNFRGADGIVLASLTTSGPTWSPYADTRVSRFVATYTLTTHAG